MRGLKKSYTYPGTQCFRTLNTLGSYPGYFRGLTSRSFFKSIETERKNKLCSFNNQIKTSFSSVNVFRLQYIHLDLKCVFEEKQSKTPITDCYKLFKKGHFNFTTTGKEINQVKFHKKQSSLYWQTAAKHLLDRFSYLFRQAYTCSIMHFMERIQILMAE